MINRCHGQHQADKRHGRRTRLITTEMPVHRRFEGLRSDSPPLFYASTATKHSITPFSTLMTTQLLKSISISNTQALQLLKRIASQNRHVCMEFKAVVKAKPQPTQ